MRETVVANDNGFLTNSQIPTGTPAYHLPFRGENNIKILKTFQSTVLLRRSSTLSQTSTHTNKYRDFSLIQYSHTTCVDFRLSAPENRV